MELLEGGKYPACASTTELCWRRGEFCAITFSCSSGLSSVFSSTTRSQHLLPVTRHHARTYYSSFRSNDVKRLLLVRRLSLSLSTRHCRIQPLCNFCFPSEPLQHSTLPSQLLHPPRSLRVPLRRSKPKIYSNGAERGGNGQPKPPTPNPRRPILQRNERNKQTDGQTPRPGGTARNRRNGKTDLSASNKTSHKILISPSRMKRCLAS